MQCARIPSYYSHNALTQQCNLVSVKTSPQPLRDAFRPPPNYCKVLNHPTLTLGAGFAETLAQEVDYLRHLRANTLEQVRFECAV